MASKKDKKTQPAEVQNSDVIDRLELYAKSGFNVLLEGKHGIGKSALITSVFGKLFTKWKYFSAPTMDPWVDFVGIPKEKTDASGKSYLEFIRPKDIDENVEAFFFDELNRAHPKIRNAVLELIQFKSINGVKLPNLKVVWAATNPPHLNYDVEALDPAQEDRFHVKISLDSAPNTAWFEAKYPNIGTQLVRWWYNQPEAERPSPRRLEYLVDVLTAGGTAQDVIYTKCSLTELQKIISIGDIFSRLELSQDSPFEERATLANKLIAENYLEYRQSLSKSIDLFKSYAFVSPTPLVASIIAADSGAKKTYSNFARDLAAVLTPVELDELPQEISNAAISNKPFSERLSTVTTGLVRILSLFGFDLDLGGTPEGQFKHTPTLLHSSFEDLYTACGGRTSASVLRTAITAEKQDFINDMAALYPNFTPQSKGTNLDGVIIDYISHCFAESKKYMQEFVEVGETAKNHPFGLFISMSLAILSRMCNTLVDARCISNPQDAVNMAKLRRRGFVIISNLMGKTKSEEQD